VRASCMMAQRIWLAPAASLALAAAAFPSAAQDVCDGWRFIDAPTPGDLQILRAVSALSETDTWAVGEYAELHDGVRDWLTLTLRWDGNQWVHVPSPSPGLGFPGGTSASLWNVEAITPEEVWAGGTQYIIGRDGFPGQQYLAMRWDGSEWEVTPTPLTPEGGTGAYILNLDSLGPGRVWACGFRVEPANPQVATVGTVLAWDGSEWVELPPTPIVSIDEHRLREIEVFAPDHILGIGGHSGNGFGPADQPYVVRWDGSSWEVLDVIPSIGLQTWLRDMDALAPDDLWVVGEIVYGDRPSEPLFVHFDGETWQRFPAPSFDQGGVQIEVVTMVSSNDVWAAGTYTVERPPDEARPLLMHFDGAEWRQVFSDPAGPEFGWFRGLDDLGRCDVWAVGQRDISFTHTQRLLGEGCRADFNGDGSVNTLDVLAFLNAFASDDSGADFDGNGVVDSRDVLAFLNVWAAGC